MLKSPQQHVYSNCPIYQEDDKHLVWMVCNSTVWIPSSQPHQDATMLLSRDLTLEIRTQMGITPYQAFLGYHAFHLGTLLLCAA